MVRFSLSAVGADRPGIVAALTGALVDAGCNLLDSTMAILQGQFAVLLVVSAPDTVSAQSIETVLAPAARRFELMLAVRPLAGSVPDAADAAGREPWVLAIHGADRPGIVHAVTAALAEVGGNVVDLATHLVDRGDTPLYAMTVRATLPPGMAQSAAEHVRAAAARVGVRCSFHRDDADIL